MTIKFNKTILSIFFCVAVLAVLTACGGGDSGGGANNTTPEPACNPDTHFCDTSGVAKATCDSATYFCDTSGVAKADCNAATYFCETTGALISACVAAIHNCMTGLFNTGGVDSTTNYEPLNTEEPPTGGWVAALSDARNTEYQADGGGADRIGAAYAHARGYTGAGIIISSMGEHVEFTNDDLGGAGQLLTGYKASDGSTVFGGGKCSGDGCGEFTTGTHVAGIMIGKSGNFVEGVDGGEIQGIAYDASIKPIDVATNNIFQPTDDDGRRMKLNSAIAAASGTVDAAGCTRDSTDTTACANITVMNNGWNPTVGAPYASGRFYKGQQPFSTETITSEERMIWEAVVDSTVVVFAHGDSGNNNENGMLKIYTTNALTVREVDDDGEVEESWKDFGAINQGSIHSQLPREVEKLKGKWLAVIALGENGRIHKYSNGCGNAQAWCLAAPGIDITSSLPGDTKTGMMSGTAQAAAYVSGAVAVVASTFPTSNGLSIEAQKQRVKDLVAIILNTADYIPLLEDDMGGDTNEVYGHGKLNLARATDPIGLTMISDPNAAPIEAGITIDNSGITLPTSFGGALGGFTVGFIDDYKRAYVGKPARITRTNAAFTLADTIATWDSPTLQSIALDSNSKMQFTNYDETEDAKDTLIFTHSLPNHTVGFAYNEESKTPDFSLANTGDEMHFQKIRPIASDLMQVNSTHKLGKVWNVKNSLTSGEFDTGNKFNEAMTNLNYTGENRQLTIGAGTLQEYGQFLGASGTGAYQLSDATSSQVTHLAISQNLPSNSAIKVKYTGFKTFVAMRYDNFANINHLTANEYQLSLTKQKVWGKSDSLNIELIQPFAVTDGNLQQSTVLGYNDQGGYNNVTQNYDLAPTNRRQQIRMTWQNQLNNLKSKTKLFISMQYENHVNNLRDKEDSSILGGVSTRF